MIAVRDLLRINAMFDLQSSPPELPPYECQARMTVQFTIASRPGFEHWTLRCTKCGHIHEAQVHIDPNCAMVGDDCAGPP
jgi:hypothetical protein